MKKQGKNSQIGKKSKKVGSDHGKWRVVRGCIAARNMQSKMNRIGTLRGDGDPVRDFE